MLDARVLQCERGVRRTALIPKLRRRCDEVWLPASEARWARHLTDDEPARARVRPSGVRGTGVHELGVCSLAWQRQPMVPEQPPRKEKEVAMHERRYGGLTVGGILVIVGVIVIFIWSFWIGLIIALIGLIAFGGFVRGKWY